MHPIRTLRPRACHAACLSRLLPTLTPHHAQPLRRQRAGAAGTVGRAERGRRCRRTCTCARACEARSAATVGCAEAQEAGWRTGAVHARNTVYSRRWSASGSRTLLSLAREARNVQRVLVRAVLPCVRVWLRAHTHNGWAGGRLHTPKHHSECTAEPPMCTCSHKPSLHRRAAVASHVQANGGRAAPAHTGCAK